MVKPHTSINLPLWPEKAMTDEERLEAIVEILARGTLELMADKGGKVEGSKR